MERFTEEISEEETINAMSKELTSEELMPEIDKYRIHLDEVIPLPPVAISYGTHKERNIDGTESEIPTPLATYGNFSFVHSYPKVGKSFFMSLLAATYQVGEAKYTKGLKGHRDNELIVHFDTEQSRYHSQKVARRPFLMNGVDDPDYHFYMLRELDYKQRRSFIETVLYVKLKDKNIGLVIIDGIADLTPDVNSMEQSTEVQELLMRWSSELNCHITTIIHSNYGTLKPTGVLGSSLEKKCETQIMLEKNEINQGWITVNCKRSRNREFDNFSFTIDGNALPEMVEAHDINF